jgi:RNA polymerase sigma factor (sigma-70 family)
MQQPLATKPRPSRAQIEPAALKLLSRHSAGLLATARRYSDTPEDAEDAYQRGVEILLTKAPTTKEDELLPWLRTVVKHEAFAVRRLNGRIVPAEESLAWEADHKAWTHERAERYERLRVGAEAMAGLKPQEIRCLLLKAEGRSYQEICEATGYSYTKVNRCLTEGRRAFLKRVAGIEAGAECERLGPLISKVADGEASRDEMRVLRPHLKGCLACKATLREYRAAPARLAGLVPPVVALAGGGGGTTGFLGRLLEAVQERYANVSEIAGAKLAAVAASAVVIAGGGAAGFDAIHHDAPAVESSAFAASEASPASAPAPSVAAPPVPSGASAPDPSTAAIEAVSKLNDPPAPPAEAADPPEKVDSPPPSGPGRTPEFDPGTTPGVSAQPDPQPGEFASPGTPALSPSSGSTPTTAPTPLRRSSGSSGSAAGEFGP